MKWNLRQIPLMLRSSEFPIPSDAPEISVEHRHGWLIPPDWEFVTEEWICTRQPVDSERRGHMYDHDSEVGIIRE